jgi:hypothetical protein
VPEGIELEVVEDGHRLQALVVSLIPDLGLGLQSAVRRGVDLSHV